MPAAPQPGHASAALTARLGEGADRLQVDLARDAAQRLVAYLFLLERWNRRFNLTAVRDPEQMVPRHLLDSLSVLPHVRGSRLLDLGSGAGLPGLVLAVARPDLEVTLLDAAQKRTRFLLEAVRTLAIGNARVVRVRAEAYRPAGRFDTVVSRAALDLPALARVSTPLLARGGRVLAMLGRAPGARDWQAELAPLRARLERLEVPGLAAERHVAVLSAGT